jgi:DNA mismatch repair ATPase MutS
LENSRKNPFYVGVPVAHADKHIKSLIGSGFTIVFVEQITKPPNPKRALTRVLSPITYLVDEFEKEVSDKIKT